MTTYPPMHFPMLSLLTLLPLTGGLAILLAGRAGLRTTRVTAAAFATAAVAGVVWLWLHFQPWASGMQFEEVHTWAPAIGLQYHVGIDGLSLVMLAVSAIVVLMAVAASWGNIRHGAPYFALLLFLETGLFGTYTALNFLHWFSYWELSLIPAFFLIRLWGGTGRAYAATQFFIYTMVGSIPLLLAFLALFLASNTFDFIQLAHMAQSGQLAADLSQNLHWHQWDGSHISMLLFCAALLGFAVKTPVLPFHGWLCAAYSEAAPETTIVLTGALSKMGVYGFLRILLPIFPTQMAQARTVLLWMALASIVLPAFAAWAQTDLKKMFAYSSINHLGYCILGIVAVAGASDTQGAAQKAAALTGVLLQLFSHGITAAALFWFLALLASRGSGQLGLNDFGGLRRAMPIYSGLMGITLFASLGLPGLIGFPGEFLIFKGVFPLAWWAAAVALIGLLMSAVWMLTLLQRVFSGPLSRDAQAPADLRLVQQFLFAPVLALIFVVGIYPQCISRILPGTVMQFVDWAR